MPETINKIASLPPAPDWQNETPAIAEEKALNFTAALSPLADELNAAINEINNRESDVIETAAAAKTTAENAAAAVSDANLGDVVHKSGTETIGGVKEFTAEIILPSKSTPATDSPTKPATEAQIVAAIAALNLDAILDSDGHLIVDNLPPVIAGNYYVRNFSGQVAINAGGVRTPYYSPAVTFVTGGTVKYRFQFSASGSTSYDHFTEVYQNNVRINYDHGNHNSSLLLEGTATLNPRDYLRFYVDYANANATALTIIATMGIDQSFASKPVLLGLIVRS